MSLPLVLVSPAFPSVVRDLRDLGVPLLYTGENPRLPSPLRFHADLVCFPLGGRRLLMAPGSPRAEENLARLGWLLIRPTAKLSSRYPGDTPLCAARVGETLFCRASSTDPEVLRSGERVVNVRQGYARCSVLPIGSRSLVTADPSIAAAAENAGFAVLCIRPGGILLPGYDTGFIGGCAVPLGERSVYLTGSLSSHPDGPALRRFAAERGVALFEGSSPVLLDIGGGVRL